MDPSTGFVVGQGATSELFEVIGQGVRSGEVAISRRRPRGLTSLGRCLLADDRPSSTAGGTARAASTSMGEKVAPAPPSTCHPLRPGVDITALSFTSYLSPVRARAHRRFAGSSPAV